MGWVAFADVFLHIFVWSQHARDAPEKKTWKCANASLRTCHRRRSSCIHGSRCGIFRALQQRRTAVRALSAARHLSGLYLPVERDVYHVLCSRVPTRGMRHNRVNTVELSPVMFARSSLLWQFLMLACMLVYAVGYAPSCEFKCMVGVQALLV